MLSQGLTDWRPAKSEEGFTVKVLYGQVVHARNILERLRAGELGETAFARMAARAVEPSASQQSTRATLDALQICSEQHRNSFTSGSDLADIYAVPNAISGGDALLLIVHRDGIVLDIAGARDWSMRPERFALSANPLLRALTDIPGTPFAKLKRNVASAHAAQPMQGLITTATSLALEVAWPERCSMRGFTGSGRFGGGITLAGYSATRDEWDALGPVRQDGVTATLVESTQRLSGLTQPDRTPPNVTTGIHAVAPPQQSSDRQMIATFSLDLRNIPWLAVSTVTPNVWRTARPDTM